MGEPGAAKVRRLPDFLPQFYPLFISLWDTSFEKPKALGRSLVQPSAQYITQGGAFPSQNQTVFLGHC